MAFGAELLIPALIAGTASAAGAAASMLIKPKTPAMPAITMPDIPDPVSPPNAPLNPSQTAALQKARARSTGGTANKDIMLSSRGTRTQEDPKNLVTRTTLLGR